MLEKVEMLMKAIVLKAGKWPPFIDPFWRRTFGGVYGVDR